MPLSPPNSRRALKHTRAIDLQAFKREDGLWDIDARISDVKTRDALLASVIRPAGSPIHDLWLRLTIDAQFNILDAEAASDAVPYPGYCGAIAPEYKQLIGLNLMKNFRRDVKLRLGGDAGCTHLTELSQVLPTAAIQAFAGEFPDTRSGASGDDQEQKPFQLDRCHALRTDGEAVARFYPRWFVTEPDEVQSN